MIRRPSLRGVCAGAVWAWLALQPAASAQAASIPPELVVSAPGWAQVVDGSDAGTTVDIDVADVTSPVSQYDFGFVAGVGYTAISGSSGLGSFSFDNGAWVDFALRDRGADGVFGTGDDVVYRLSDPMDYADQRYTNPIDAGHAGDPGFSGVYYQLLTIDWYLQSGSVVSVGFTVAGGRDPYDGFVPVTVVPLAPAAWFMISGLLLLGGYRRRMIAGKC